MSVAPERVHYDRFSEVIDQPGYQTLRSYPMRPGEVCRLEVTILAATIDGLERATMRRLSLFFRAGTNDVAEQPHALQTLDTAKSNKGFDLRLIPSSTNLILQVKNPGNVNTRWDGYTDKIEIFL